MAGKTVIYFPQLHPFKDSQFVKTATIVRVFEPTMRHLLFGGLLEHDNKL
jgi:hypothetical protein